MKHIGSVMNKYFSLAYNILEISKLLLQKSIMMKIHQNLGQVFIQTHLHGYR